MQLEVLGILEIKSKSLQPSIVMVWGGLVPKDAAELSSIDFLDQIKNWKKTHRQSKQTRSKDSRKVKYEHPNDFVLTSTSPNIENVYV